MALNFYKNPYLYLTLLLAVVLAVIAVAVALHHYYVLVAGTKAEFTLSWHIYFNLFYWECWLFFIPFLKLAVHKIKTGSKNSRAFIFYFCMPLLIVFVHQAIASVVIYLILHYQDILTLIRNRILASPWTWVDFVLYFIVLLGLYVIEHGIKINEEKIRNAQLQSQLFNTQLEALKSQIHPHFLFNVLNTLSTLILKNDNDEAIRMLALMKKFLYTTINDTGKNEVTLEEEIRSINHYLEIEKVRFKNKLEVEEIISPETKTAVIPGFILQPLVENAIHHAVSPQKDKGIIRIKSEKENSELVLIIQDNGPGFDEKAKSKKSGIGLKLTKERLNHMYNANHTFAITNSGVSGSIVIIKIPFQAA